MSNSEVQQEGNVFYVDTGDLSVEEIKTFLKEFAKTRKEEK